MLAASSPVSRTLPPFDCEWTPRELERPEYSELRGHRLQAWNQAQAGTLYCMYSELWSK